MIEWCFFIKNFSFIIMKYRIDIVFELSYYGYVRKTKFVRKHHPDRVTNVYYFADAENALNTERNL
jgi:hypothetical protein